MAPASRHGAAASHTEEDCETLANSILRGDDSGLLRGRLGEDIDVDCGIDGPEMVAIATGWSRWWIGGLPDLGFELVGRAVLETFSEGP